MITMLHTLYSRVKVEKAMEWGSLLLLVLLVGMAFAETQIDIESTMAGKNPNDLFLIVRNLGPDPLEGIEIYVDDSLVERLDLHLSAGRAIKVYTYLPFGKHRITVKGIPSGEDSIEIMNLEYKGTTTTVISQREEGNNMIRGLHIKSRKES